LQAHRAQRRDFTGINPSWQNGPRHLSEGRASQRRGAGSFDGARAPPTEGPFDVIILSGSVAEVPQALLANLKVGGRLIGIVGEEPFMRATIVTRTGDASFKTSTHMDTVGPTLAQFPRTLTFRF